MSQFTQPALEASALCNVKSLGYCVYICLGVFVLILSPNLISLQTL